MEVPTDTNVVTYANADITDTIETFERYGFRFLTADEIRTEMPRYSSLTRRNVMCGG
jgi:hypothetical protein